MEGKDLLSDSDSASSGGIRDSFYQGSKFCLISPVPFVRFLKASKVTH